MPDNWVYVSDLPTCDIHQYDKGDGNVPAGYDGKTKMGPWASMCEPCFEEVGVGLGLGKGQLLIVRHGPDDPARDQLTPEEAARVKAAVQRNETKTRK